MVTDTGGGHGHRKEGMNSRAIQKLASARAKNTACDFVCLCVCVGVLYGRVGREKQKWHNVLEY